MLDFFFFTRSLQTVPFERTMASTSSTNGAEQTPRTIAASDRAELGAECAPKEGTGHHNFHFNVWCERLGDHPLRKSHCDAARPPNEVCTRSFDASNVKKLSGDRSPETPQPVLIVDS